MGNKVEPTEMQKRAADEIIRQKISEGKVNKGKALAKAGYSEQTQKSPKLVTESQGFKAYMAEAGITEASIAKMLAYDLEAKPADRLGELKLTTELLGIKENNLNVNVRKSDEGLEDLASIISSMSDEDDEEGEAS